MSVSLSSTSSPPGATPPHEKRGRNFWSTELDTRKSAEKEAQAPRAPCKGHRTQAGAMAEIDTCAQRFILPLLQCGVVWEVAAQRGLHFPASFLPRDLMITHCVPYHGQGS